MNSNSPSRLKSFRIRCVSTAIYHPKRTSARARQLKRKRGSLVKAEAFERGVKRWLVSLAAEKLNASMLGGADDCTRSFG